jgi:hypothetical protein
MAKTTTKGTLVLFALRKFAVASNATLTDVEPQSVADGLDDLEDMMAEWKSRGIDVGYLFSDDDNPVHPDDDSGLLPEYKSCVGWQLMLRLMPDYSIEPSPRQETNAQTAYEALLTATISVPSIQRRGDMPTGQGNKYDYFMMGRFYPDERGPANGDDPTSTG